MVYGGIVFVWIFAPLVEMTLGVLSTNITVTCIIQSKYGVLSTDIIKGTCVPWGAYSSYAEAKSITFVLLFFAYLLPLMTMLFCYYRIVYAIKHKVSSTS